MTIQDWGAIGEIIGAAAVVASLIYLAVQIRQNTRRMTLTLESAKLAAFERNVESGNRTRELLISNPELADLFLRGVTDYEGLRPTDKFRCDLLFRNVFSSIQGGYVRQQAIDNDAARLSGAVAVVDSLVKSKGVRDWLADNTPDWRPEFAACVRERAANFASTDGAEAAANADQE